MGGFSVLYVCVLGDIKASFADFIVTTTAPEDSLAKRFQKSLGEEKRGHADEEQGPSSNKNGQQAQQKPAPDIALNLHGWSRSHELYFAAVSGILLQFGMLVFSGFAVYHPVFSSRFPKNGAKVRPYAYSPSWLWEPSPCCVAC
jgi:hypothetical protein